MDYSRLPSPSLSSRACSNSCPLNQWCHPTISSSVPPSSLLLVFPRVRVFSNESALLIRWPNYWSFSFITSPSNEYSGLIYFRIDGLISLLSKRLSRILSSTTVRKHQFFGAQLSLWSNSHIHIWPIRDHRYTLPLNIWNFILWHPIGVFFSIFSDQKISFSWCFCLILSMKEGQLGGLSI